MHGGHTNRVADLSWNLNEPWVLATTAEDNICQIWQPARSIYVGDDDIRVDPEMVGEPPSSKPITSDVMQTD